LPRESLFDGDRLKRFADALFAKKRIQGRQPFGAAQFFDRRHFRFPS
jgi:hypothetical protein